MADAISPVRKRHVFYVPGYDPHPARRYRELYRKEGARQAETSGYRLAVRGATGPRYGWEVAAEIEDARVRTRFEVLEWSDIVRKTMDQSLPGTFVQLLRVAWTYISTGTLRRLMWLGKGPMLAGFYPVVALLLQLFAAVLAGRTAGGLVAGAVDWVVSFVFPGLGWAWLAWLVALPVAAYVLIWFRRQDKRVYVHYLMHDLAYSAQARGAYPPELAARISEFARALERALAQEVDEVLVVGHSSGASLAVSMLAEVLRTGDLPPDGPALSLLTLGQAIPMQSFLPDAKRLRRDLHELSQSDKIAWVDVSAPGDGCCFALADPVAVSGVAPASGQRWPLVISAAFSKTLSPETLKGLRWRFFRLHFQYLCAFDYAEGYDYFAITAGHRTLFQRFSERQPSANRIDVKASRYISMAA